jgi:thermitase
MNSQDYVPWEIIVKFKTSKINLKTPGWKITAQSFAVNNGMQTVDSIDNNNISVMAISWSDGVEQKIIQLQANANVEYAQPNYIYHILSTWFDDIHSWLLRWLPQIEWYQAYELFSGNVNTTGTIVAVIDAGVAYDHPDLSANMRSGSTCKSNTWLQINNCLYGYDFADNDNNPYPVRSDHGTHVAGTIAAAANNGIWIIWVNPHAQIMAIRVGDDSMTTLAIANGIDFARHNGAKIINASFGAYDYDQYMYDAVQSFGLSGGLFIAAAGNDARNHAISGVSYPCGYDLENIICVAATNASDGLASFSDYGITSVDLWAPGTNIYSTVIDLLENDMYTNNFSWSLWDMLTGWINFSRWSQNNMAMWWYSWFASTYTIWIQDSYIEKTVNLTGYLWYNLSIKTYCDTPFGSNWDFLEISFLSWWNEIVLIQTTEHYEPYINQNSWINLISYTWWVSTVFYREEFDFDVNAFQSKDLKIRARWYSDDIADQTNNMWCMIDYIQLEWISDNGLTYWYMNWTSMATPHVAGLASLAWSMRPEIGYQAIKSVILGSGDSLASLSWKTVSWKRINAYATLMALWYTSWEMLAQTYNAIWLSLSWWGIQNNFNTINTWNLSNFSWLYFAVMSWWQELGRITFTTGLDLTDTGTQAFLSWELPNSLWMQQWKIRFTPWTWFSGKRATLWMNLPASFSWIISRINSWSFIVREWTGRTGTITDNTMISAVTWTCTITWCQIRFNVDHFTSFEIKPQLVQVHIQSNTIWSTSYAKSWSIVTVNFTWSDNLTWVVVVINWLTGMVTWSSLYRYSNFTVTWWTAQTPITFSINYQNLSWATGNTVFSTTDTSSVTVDTIVPTLTWSASVSVSNQTATFIFTSNEIWSITYSWMCWNWSLTNSISWNNTTTFAPGNNTYIWCQLKITDTAGNISSRLTLPTFTINYTAPSWGWWWWGWWWWWTPPPPLACTTAQVICTWWIYIRTGSTDCTSTKIATSCTLSWDILSWTKTWADLSWLTALNTDKIGNTQGSHFSPELNAAYLYAYNIGITTQSTVQQADLTGSLIRKHLAKMISNFAIKELGKTPNTWLVCTFTDMHDETTEMKLYSKLACQLGLMGLDTNWIPIQTFNPDGKVTRAQFGTVLSRTLRDTIYNGGNPYYVDHLNALQEEQIMNQINTPGSNELRWYVMLMLMRSTKN